MTSEFLEECSGLLEQYLKEEKYEILKEGRNSFPHFSNITQIAFYIYPVNFPKDRSSPATTIVIREDGTIHCSSTYYKYQIPAYTQNRVTNVHKPDSFLEVKQFLDKVFSDWQT